MYVGEVRQVLDSTRSGQVKVWIEDFAGPDKTNPDLWRSVSPVSPFYGTTNPPTEQQTGEGSYVLNKQSYGMWFTPPDIGTQLICFFASGDSNYGYYLGAVVEPGINHMLPAIGASRNYKLDNSAQQPYFNRAHNCRWSSSTLTINRLMKIPSFTTVKNQYTQLWPQYCYSKD
jgi:hypothetical protein